MPITAHTSEQWVVQQGIDVDQTLPRSDVQSGMSLCEGVKGPGVLLAVLLVVFQE